MYILKSEIKTTCFGRIWPSSGFMSIKISLYKLRYDVESSHRIIVEICLCIGEYYATLIRSVPPVVQGSHPGVCRVSSWDV